MDYNNPNNQKYIREIFNTQLKLYSYKSTTKYEIILSLLKKNNNHELNSFYDKLINIPENIIKLLTLILNSWGLLDHGTDISFAWLTEDGEIIMEFLRNFGTDENIWPDWVFQYER